jgi:molybdate transport system substrate-binding protein
MKRNWLDVDNKNGSQRTKVLASLLLVLLVMNGCTNTPSTITAKPLELTVCAGVGLTDAIKEINSLYMQENKNITIVANFAAAGTLQEQIEQGAPGDVFFSPGISQMDALQEGGLIINETRKDLLNNKIVLVVPTNSTLNITDFVDLVNEDVAHISIGDPDFVPAGTYGIQALDAYGITEQLQPKLILCNDVRQVLSYVESGNVEAGIVYASDAVITDNVKIVAEAPDEVNRKIAFVGAVIRSSKNVEAANDYIAFLASDKASAIFEKYGFSMATN